MSDAENTFPINFQPMPKRFMVWDKEKKEFVKSIGIFDLYMRDSLQYVTTGGVYFADNPDFIIVQSTNLFDKDGKEIFEGSIVKVPDDWDEYGMAAGEKYEVYFNAGGFRLKPHADYAVERGDKGYWLDDATDFELLGHVLSNPELLEEK